MLADGSHTASGVAADRDERTDVAFNDYPIDVRVGQPPEHSSRGWAALGVTFFLKVLMLLPHGICLAVLTIVQIVVAFVAQIVVAVTGEYPAGMFDFVAGVLRWSTRVTTFFLSLNDRYPPFSLQPDPGYPSDLVIARPARSSRLYALFTVIVEILAGIAVVAVLVDRTHTVGSGNGFSFSSRGPSFSSSGLVLRDIAAIPHGIVLFFLFIAVAVLWYVAQWVILVTARYPHGWFDFTAGVVRWQTRVSGYALGLIDRYPPFTFDPSIATATVAGPGQMPLSGAPGGYAPWTGAAGQAPPGPGAPGPGMPGPAPGQPAAGAPPWTGPITPIPPAGWYPDPASRHEYRYWNGGSWTAQVADRGQASVDPLGP